MDVEEDSQRAVDLFREMTEIMRGQDLETRVEAEVRFQSYSHASIFVN